MFGFKHELNLIPMQIDKETDNRIIFLEEEHVRHPSHLHLNAVAIWHGEMYALFNKSGVIANLDRDEIVIQDKALKHAHNLIIEEDGTAFVNNTFVRATHIYNLKSKKLVHTINLSNFGLVRQLIYKHTPGYVLRGILKKLSLHRAAARPVFVRGLEKLDNFLFIGISPATILCIDVNSGKLIDSFTYSKDVRSCIHGIKVLAE